MNKSLFRFTFKPAVESQRELIHQWLQQGYISEWIYGQGLQNTVSGLEKFFQYQAKGKSLDRQTEITQHWIGYEGNKPFVYLLTSNVFKNTADAYAKYSELDGLAITSQEMTHFQHFYSLEMMRAYEKFSRHHLLFL
jgi:hypothetical protein